MTSKVRSTQATIDMSALEYNWAQILKMMGRNLPICPMVKANAYGHGSVRVASKLIDLGVQQIGVSLVEEGLELIQSGINCEILVFGFIQPDKLYLAIEAGLIPVLNHLSQLEFLRNNFINKKVTVHVKFNTGMNRLGFEPNDVDQVLSFFKTNTNVQLKGLHSHFHSGESADDPTGSSFQQAQIFDHIAASLSDLTDHLYLLNSAGIVSKNKVALDISHYLNQAKWGSRPGIMLYGYHSDVDYLDLPLKPVMSLQTEIVKIRRIKKGESVSYGANWVASQDSLTAVVPIGYADGLHRLLSNQAEVMINGQRFPVIGTVCMDHIMLDISGSTKSIQEGDRVLIFGEHDGDYLGADQLAHLAKTISYEILTSVSQRVPRILKGENK